MKKRKADARLARRIKSHEASMERLNASKQRGYKRPGSRKKG